MRVNSINLYDGISQIKKNENSATKKFSGYNNGIGIKSGAGVVAAVPTGTLIASLISATPIGASLFGSTFII